MLLRTLARHVRYRYLVNSNLIPTQVNVLTLTEASINFNGDIEASAYYVIQNVLPNMVPQPSHPNTNGKFGSYSFEHCLSLNENTDYFIYLIMQI
jgi:hypothetical protein